jgi:hypothetical protein
MQAQNTPQLPRLTLKNMHVMIDRKAHPIINMNIQDVLIGGLPDWMVVGQRVEFSFVITLKEWERSLPTYGVVIKNDSSGLDVRYTPPTPSWRNIMMKLVSEEARAAAVKK